MVAENTARLKQVGQPGLVAFRSILTAIRPGLRIYLRGCVFLLSGALPQELLPLFGIFDTSAAYLACGSISHKPCRVSTQPPCVGVGKTAEHSER